MIFIWKFNRVHPTSLFGGKNSAILLQPKLKLLLPCSYESKIFNIYLSLADHFRSWRLQHLPITLLILLWYTLVFFSQSLDYNFTEIKIWGNRPIRWGFFLQLTEKQSETTVEKVENNTILAAYVMCQTVMYAYCMPPSPGFRWDIHGWEVHHIAERQRGVSEVENFELWLHFFLLSPGREWFELCLSSKGKKN